MIPTPPAPGAVERYDIDRWATSQLFKQGHRLRVEISSSSFPRYNRNLNTGSTDPAAMQSALAHQQILHAGQDPSHTLLQVIA